MPTIRKSRTACRFLLGLAAWILSGAASALDPGAYQIVDLSHTYDEKTLYWPTSPSRFEKERLFHGVTDGGWFYSANTVCTPEHGGTHLDAPVHFAEGALTNDELPLDHLIGPAIVVDVSDQAAADRDYLINVTDFQRWEASNGQMPDGIIVLLRTGFGAFWPDREAEPSATT